MAGQERFHRDDTRTRPALAGYSRPNYKRRTDPGADRRGGFDLRIDGRQGGQCSNRHLYFSVFLLYEMRVRYGTDCILQ